MIPITAKRDPELYPYRHGLYFSGLHALNWQVAIGAPTVLFMQHLGANSFQVALVFSWTFLLAPAQVFATAFLPRLGFKRLTLSGWSLRGWTLLVPILLTVFAADQRGAWPIYGMIVASFCYCFIRAIGMASLTTWLYVLVPEKVRGRYWATDQLMAGIAVVGSLLFYAGLFRAVRAETAFIVVYGVAILGAWAARRQLDRLPDAERPKTVTLEQVGHEAPRLMFRASLFRIYLWLSVLFYVAITPISPFATLYLKSTAHITSSSILLLTMLTYLGLIAANLFMRSQLDQRGAKPFFRISYIAHALLAASWLGLIATDGRLTALLPVMYFVQGVGSGCWTSANLNYLAKILPVDNRALPVALHGAVITFFGGCAPVLWGIFLRTTESGGGVNVPVLMVFFASLLALSFYLSVALGRLPEQATATGPLLPDGWLFRPFRALVSLIDIVEWSSVQRRSTSTDNRDHETQD